MPITLQPGGEPVTGYTLVEPLGQGGFGQVWKATAPGGFSVAMKFVQLASSAVDFERRALETIREIRHPHLLDIQFAVQIEDWLIIGMPLCDRSLADRLRECLRQRRSGIPVEELINYMIQAAKAIDYLNERRHRSPDGSLIGIQHRDIKPSNMFLIGDVIRVADFGLAKILQGTVSRHTGAMTPVYAAPEMFGGQVAQQSDQYSLAISYCELRTGTVPFTGSPSELMYAHLHKKPDLSRLPPSEQSVINRALAKEPENRWQSCQALVEALSKAAGVVPELMSPAPPQSDQPARAVRTKQTPRTPRPGVDTPSPPALPPIGPSVAPVARPPLPPPTVHAETSPAADTDRSTPVRKTPLSNAPKGSRSGSTDRSIRSILWSAAIAGIIVSLVVAVVAGIRRLQPRHRFENAVVGSAEYTIRVSPPDAEIRVEGGGVLSGQGETRKLLVANPDSQTPITLHASRDGFRSRQTGVTPGSDTASGIVIDLPPLKPGDVETNSLGMKLVVIPAGEFTMGANDAELGRIEGQFQIQRAMVADESPAHRVRITKPFLLGVHEVSIGQFRRFVDSERYVTDAEKGPNGAYGLNASLNAFQQHSTFNWRNTGFAQSDDQPVVNISWNDANAFCSWLSRREGVEYRLPTEAEWEYACRAGTTTMYWTGDDPNALTTVANVRDAQLKTVFPNATGCATGNDGFAFSAPVGRYRANPYGLHDMHGNVSEWCLDNYDPRYFARSDADDPAAATGSNVFVLRGGSFGSDLWQVRSASRLGGTRDARRHDLGFRVARSK
jgi:formylglycine-generating enzyme required for sulfatase activity/serine/threonine protein kinase